jgi:hypothetical protein
MMVRHLVVSENADWQAGRQAGRQAVTDREGDKETITNKKRKEGRKGSKNNRRKERRTDRYVLGGDALVVREIFRLLLAVVVAGAPKEISLCIQLSL